MIRDHRPPEGGKRHRPAPRNSTKLGYNYQWQRVRKAFLGKNPLCKHCLEAGRTTAARDVDHILPHKGNSNLFWDESNWQALCAPCHSTKTATENNFGKAPKPSFDPTTQGRR